MSEEDDIVKWLESKPNHGICATMLLRRDLRKQEEEEKKKEKEV